MSDKLKFDLVSPEKLLLSSDVDMVSVPGTEGDFGVLVNHSPMMSVLRPGLLLVENDGSQEPFFVQGGFADVTPEGLTVLAEKALPVKDLSASDIDAEIALAQEADNTALVEALENLKSEI